MCISDKEFSSEYRYDYTHCYINSRFTYLLTYYTSLLGIDNVITGGRMTGKHT